MLRKNSGGISPNCLLPMVSHTYRPASRDTLARWLREVLDAAGVNIGKYRAHSTRSAAVSAAHSKDLPIDTIISTVGWSSDRTFVRFYNKPVEQPANFALTVLSC